MAFQHILIPVDFTDKDQLAVNAACELTHLNRCRITVLHVIETIDGLEHHEVKDLYDKLEDNARTKLRQIGKSFQGERFELHLEVNYGKRGPEIVRYATAEDVDLVILSSHKIDFKEPRENWGSLSYQVAVVCPCPVLLVK